MQMLLQSEGSNIYAGQNGSEYTIARTETINLALGSCRVDGDCLTTCLTKVEYWEKWKRTVTSSKCSNFRQRLGNDFESDFECLC